MDYSVIEIIVAFVLFLGPGAACLAFLFYLEIKTSRQRHEHADYMLKRQDRMHRAIEIMRENQRRGA